MQLDAFCTTLHGYLDSEYARLRETSFDERYGKLQTELFRTHTQLFFYFVTGEPDFDAFYDRLQKRVKGRPIGWGKNGFVPDLISSVIYDDDHGAFQERWAKVERLYKEAQKLEADYLKRRSHDRKKR